MAAGKNSDELHLLLFPFTAQGHLLPLVDMAKLLAAHGARVTILTTTATAAYIRTNAGDSIYVHTIPFPYADFGLPEGCETRALTLPEDLRFKFYQAITSLRHPFDTVLRELRPDCIISDMFLPWTQGVATACGIPRLIFKGCNLFVRCAIHELQQLGRHLLEADEPESFVIPNIPHRIEMLKTQKFDDQKLTGGQLDFVLAILKEASEVEPLSCGEVVNTFYELEPDYADYCRDVIGGSPSWAVGPVSLVSCTDARGVRRGEDLASAERCLEWLNGKPPGSVVYMCFGSIASFSASQMREMALGLEACGHPFVWAVKAGDELFLPRDYEERIKGRGTVIRGWAPQLQILNHCAMGGFVTHCGWNSSLEGICAGLPMVTWPLFADQFLNEKLLVEVLKIGVAVGSAVYTFDAEARPLVEAGAVAAAVGRMMGVGDEAEARRRRAAELRKMARRAMEKGGSSYEGIEKLLQVLRDQKNGLCCGAGLVPAGEIST